MLAAIKSFTGIGNDQQPDIENKPEQMQKPDENANNTQIKLLGQGSYGCIFRPGIECSRKQLTTKKYIAKIQKYKETSKHEVEIGKKIKGIAGYSQYYAPIIETCDVTVSTLKNEEEVKKCDFIKTSPEFSDKKYESNRVMYVGKNIISEYLIKETANIRQVENYFRKMINMHMMLLTGIMKLNDANIIHFDLKENNVMCRDKSGRPIIIDFGLSVDSANIASPEFPAAETFFSYGVTYAPWCLDIGMITYMIHKTQNAHIEQPVVNAWRSKTATLNDTSAVISDFLTKNPSISSLFTSAEIEEYKVKLEAYYKPLVEGGMMNMPTWGHVYDELVKYHKSWDNYSLAVMFLNILNILDVQKLAANELPFMKVYINILKKIVLSMPDKRPTAGDTKEELSVAMHTVARKDKATIGKLFKPEFENVEKYKQRSRRVNDSIHLSMKADEYLLVNKQKMMNRIKKNLQQSKKM